MFEHIPFFMDYEFIHELCNSPENVKNSRWKFLPTEENPFILKINDLKKDEKGNRHKREDSIDILYFPVTSISARDGLHRRWGSFRIEKKKNRKAKISNKNDLETLFSNL